MTEGSSGDADLEAYRWLLAAADFGHNINAVESDMFELTSLHDGDDAATQFYTHLDLSRAYLLGSDGLPLDLSLAEKHLKSAKQVYGSKGIREELSKKFLRSLNDDARAIVKQYT